MSPNAQAVIAAPEMADYSKLDKLVIVVGQSLLQTHPAKKKGAQQDT